MAVKKTRSQDDWPFQSQKISIQFVLTGSTYINEDPRCVPLKPSTKGNGQSTARSTQQTRSTSYS